MDRTTKVEGVRKAWDKYKYVALVALAGAVLLLWPEGGGSDRAAESGSSGLTAQVRDVETEMEDHRLPSRSLASLSVVFFMPFSLSKLMPAFIIGWCFVAMKHFVPWL